MISVKKQINKINLLLISFYGIPEKNKNNPDIVDTLIGTILSQNTNDKNSYKAYNNLKRYKSWEEVEKLPASKILSLIKIAGLGEQKTYTIKSALKKIKEYNFDLKWLNNKSNDEIIAFLTSIKGVGNKTASCVLLFSMSREVCPVDTHVHRTLNRIGLVKTSSPDKTFEIINNNFDKDTAHSFHTNLIRLGREICKPKNPACGICPLFKICKYELKNQSNQKKSKVENFMLLDNLY